MDSMGAFAVDRLRDTFQIEGNIGLLQGVGLLQCVMFCLRKNTCLTIFFNSVTNQCILHSTTFHFRKPTGKEAGWEAFQTVDLTGRCTGDFLYYRELDLCYKIYNSTYQNMNNYDLRILPDCYALESELIRIDTAQKNDYIGHVLDGADDMYACVQGNNYQTLGVWTYDDGTPMPFLPWATTPRGNMAFRLAMILPDMLLRNIYIPQLDTCCYICEIPTGNTSVPLHI